MIRQRPMSLRERMEANAKAMAMQDYVKGLDPEPYRHEAKEESAWAVHYLAEFERLKRIR